MGCDIHAHIEFKEPHWKADDTWSRFAALRIDRWYALFGAMAGARCADIEHIPPRGLPDGLSWHTRDAFKEDELDAHSTSWLTRDELASAVDRAGKHPDPGVIATLAIMDAFTASGWPVRIVFWFDN